MPTGSRNLGHHQIRMEEVPNLEVTQIPELLSWGWTDCNWETMYKEGGNRSQKVQLRLLHDFHNTIEILNTTF